MSKFTDFFAWIFVSLILLWFAGMIFAGNPCARVNRAAWPITLPMVAIESLSENWTSDSTKLTLLLWKAKGAVFVQTVFEKTVYGEDSKCKK